MQQTVKWSRLFYLCATVTTLTIPFSIFASDFNLPFINASDLGNMYAGWAASATDASTATTNPAGLTRLKTPQLVVAMLDVSGNTQFTGRTGTPFSSQSGTANGTLGGGLPLFYISKPLTERITVAFGESAPFALGTHYDKSSIVRYSATKSQILVADVSPSIGFKINKSLSVGLGLDIDRIFLTLNNMYGPPLSTPDGEGQNHLWGTGLGAHAGVLYEINPCIRVGLNFTSQVSFHLSGNSQVYSIAGNGRVRQTANIPMPALGQLSIYSDVTPRWAAMATVFYTHWSTVQQLTLQNTALPGGFTAPVSIPLRYHNTVDYFFGTNFKATQKWVFKGGMQLLNTPTNNQVRIVADPISTMVLMGIGAHYQQNPCVGYDIGYSHDFFHQAHIRQVTAVTSAVGHSITESNIVGAQVTWNI